MSSYLIKQLDVIDNVVVRTTTEVVEACGDGHLQRLVLSDRTSGEKQTVDAASMFVFIGAAPRTDWLDGVVQRDARRAGRWTATPTTWSPAFLACSWPATCGPTRSSGSPPRSAKERWQ